MAALDYTGKPGFKLPLHDPVARAGTALRSASTWPIAPCLRNRCVAQSALGYRGALSREFALVDCHCAPACRHALVDGALAARSPKPNQRGLDDVISPL